VLVGGTVHFKGPTGGYQTMPYPQLAAIYDPLALLNPDKGIAKLLATAADPVTEADEGAVYRVATSLSQQALAAVVPGVAEGVNGKIWIDKATSRLVKAELPLAGGKATVTLSDFDVPVQVTPPAN
jgi:lipoprotein LprG